MGTIVRYRSCFCRGLVVIFDDILEKDYGWNSQARQTS